MKRKKDKERKKKKVRKKRGGKEKKKKKKKKKNLCKSNFLTRARKESLSTLFCAPTETNKYL